MWAVAICLIPLAFGILWIVSAWSSVRIQLRCSSLSWELCSTQLLFYTISETTSCSRSYLTDDEDYHKIMAGCCSKRLSMTCDVTHHDYFWWRLIRLHAVVLSTVWSDNYFLASPDRNGAGRCSSLRHISTCIQLPGSLWIPQKCKAIQKRG